MILIRAQKIAGPCAGADCNADHVQQQDILPAAPLTRVEGLCESEPGEEPSPAALCSLPPGPPLDQVCSKVHHSTSLAVHLGYDSVSRHLRWGSTGTRLLVW